MFVDLLGVADGDATDALECLCKSLADGGGDGDASIWAPHPSPFLTTLVESFTQNGLQVSGAMADELVNWLTGKMYSAKYAGSPQPGPAPWAVADLPAVHAWLASKRPQDMTFSDWAMLGDYIVSIHASPRFAQAHADWLAARTSAMARLQVARPALSVAQADNALASLPSTVEQMVAAFAFTPAQRAAMEYATVHCAESITSATNALRAGVKATLLQDMVQKRAPGAPGHALQTQLLDAFGRFNKDWRRIAVTEAGEAQNQGMIASLPPLARVRRVEMYAGACSFCRKLHGKVFTVVATDAPDKDGQTQVWPGKSNVGRSASPTRIVDGRAQPRTADELWWPAAGVQHPHCRGMWTVQTASPEGGQPSGAAPDANWAAWLSALGLA